MEDEVLLLQLRKALEDGASLGSHSGTSILLVQLFSWAATRSPSIVRRATDLLLEHDIDSDFFTMVVTEATESILASTLLENSIPFRLYSLQETPRRNFLDIAVAKGNLDLALSLHYRLEKRTFSYPQQPLLFLAIEAYRSDIVAVLSMEDRFDANLCNDIELPPIHFAFRNLSRSAVNSSYGSAGSFGCGQVYSGMWNDRAASSIDILRTLIRHHATILYKHDIDLLPRHMPLIAQLLVESPQPQAQQFAEYLVLKRLPTLKKDYENARHKTSRMSVNDVEQVHRKYLDCQEAIALLEKRLKIKVKIPQPPKHKSKFVGLL